MVCAFILLSSLPRILIIDISQYTLHWLDLTKAGFHTHNGKADFLPPLNFYTNELTNHVCIIANGSLVCFSWCLFLGFVWHARVHLWSSNGSGVTGRAPTWLEIATWPGRKLGHQIGYYLWYLDLEWASGEILNGPQVRPSSSVSFNTWKTRHFCGSPPPLTSTPIIRGGGQGWWRATEDHLWSFMIMV